MIRQLRQGDRSCLGDHLHRSTRHGAVEFFRGNPAIIAWDIPAAQVFSVALILIAVAGFYILGKNERRTA